MPTGAVHKVRQNFFFAIFYLTSLMVATVSILTPHPKENDSIFEFCPLPYQENVSISNTSLPPPFKKDDPLYGQPNLNF